MDLSPFVNEAAQCVGAAILGAWAYFSHQRNMNAAAADLVYHALDSAVHWAEAQIGELSHDHLDNIQLKNSFLASGLEYLNTHVPDAMKRLKLDDVEQEEKLIVTLSRYLGSKPILGELMVGHTDPAPIPVTDNPALAPAVMPVSSS